MNYTTVIGLHKKENHAEVLSKRYKQPLAIFTRLGMAVLFLVAIAITSTAQRGKVNWSPDGEGYISYKAGNVVQIDPKSGKETTLINAEDLTPPGMSVLQPQSFEYSRDNSSVLFFTNTAKVWRYNTRGDYWVLDVRSRKLKKLGRDLPSQSLMFAKFSPDGNYVAYVSEHNLFVENLQTGLIKKLTSNGSRKMINGTFDWVYEEEFNERDGFRWSEDSKQIAFWQIDATKIRDYYMLNTIDSSYSQIIPVEYPKVGEAPSPAKIAVVNISNGYTKFMDIEGDPAQHYLTRMEWSGPSELIIQQLDRKQQESRLIYANTATGSSYTFWAEGDKAWVDLNTDNPVGWNWVNKGADFIWVSEKDGWRHIYKISRDGKNVELLTKGNYDIGEVLSIDEKNNSVYFTASPYNPTQEYMYRVKINGPDANPELLTEKDQVGVHKYEVAPGGKIAKHTFSNRNTPQLTEWVSLPTHKPLDKSSSIEKNIKTVPSNVEYVKITTVDNIELDAWINKPANFDPKKKYPSIFYVYGEPAASTVMDEFGNHNNFLYNGDIAADGYIQVSIDNRGTPMLKGAAWRKSIYRKIGEVNIKDIAHGAKKLLENSYFDKERVAVWGWSGGGSTTLHLMFRYPEIFKTGVAIAAVGNQLFYDNIYQERYMGLPQENRDDFVNGSPATYAKGLQGNLLYVHGTGDDNVHYSNAEYLINELVKYNRQFQFMAYPNRSHGLSEGKGTFLHLATMYTEFMKKNNPPGAR